MITLECQKFRKENMYKVAVFVLSMVVCGILLWHLAIISLLIPQVRSGSKLAKEVRANLLCNVDYEALLVACRKVLDEAEQGRWDKEYVYRIRGNAHPAVNKLPEEILRTNPASLRIDGRVTLEYMGGMIHFGVIAYPEDFAFPHGIFSAGDKMLIEGLWYYDDGYHCDPDYDAKIKAIMQARRKQ